jgi:hypothetical protein
MCRYLNQYSVYHIDNINQCYYSGSPTYDVNK